MPPTAEKNVVIYARVSTNSQDLEHQIASCERFCEYKGFKVLKVYSDTGSGKTWSNRPEFVKLIEDLRALKYSGVVVFRLDRLFRKTVEALNFFQEWNNKGIEIYSITENLDSSTAIGKAMRDIILVLAQLERENIAEATRARLQALKDSGKKLGRPSLSSYQIRKIKEYRAEDMSFRKIAEKMRLKKSVVAKYGKS